MLSACSGNSTSFLDDLELPTLGKRDDGSKELNMPPGLYAPTRKDRYDVPGSANSVRMAAMSDHVLPQRPDMRLRREGNTAWLSIDMAPVQLWPHIKNFWIDYGFRVVNEKSVFGSMETDWLEQSLRSGEDIRIQDKFLTRLDRDSNAITHIYIVNRKNLMSDGKRDIVFSDTETEINVLYDLMTYLAGVKNEEDLANLPALEDIQFVLDIHDNQGIPILTIGHPYSQVWRLLGSALSRADLEIIKNDRSRGTYLIRYAPADDVADRIIQLHLLSGKTETLVTAHLNRSNGNVLTYDVAYDILQRIMMAY